MQRALGHKCEHKYKCLEYYWKSGKTKRVYATDAHICLAAVDHNLKPGYYDTNWNPVRQGNWITQDVDSMFENTTQGGKPCKLEKLGCYYITIEENWVFKASNVDLLTEWLGGQPLLLSENGCLYGKSKDEQRLGVCCHEDKRYYTVGPSKFLTEKEAREFAAMMGVKYV